LRPNDSGFARWRWAMPQRSTLQRDAEMMRYFGGPYRPEQTETWLQWHVAMWDREGYSHWAAELKEADTFVG
jgi:RimJ/RimL family protein N-acetyltransferase